MTGSSGRGPSPAVTYAEIGQAACCAPPFHEAGSAPSEVCALISLAHEPRQRSRKRSAPPLPSTPTQYAVPASRATGAIVTGLHAPGRAGALEPVLNSEPGWPFASA